MVGDDPDALGSASELILSFLKLRDDLDGQDEIELRSMAVTLDKLSETYE